MQGISVTFCDEFTLSVATCMPGDQRHRRISAQAIRTREQMQRSTDEYRLLDAGLYSSLSRRGLQSMAGNAYVGVMAMCQTSGILNMRWGFTVGFLYTGT